jgi:hypothetical protein
MMIWMHRAAAYLLAVQGLAYTVAAAAVFDRLSLDALRFAGTGLSWIFLATLNLASLASGTRRVVTMTVGANVLAVLYFVLLAVAAPSWRTALAILIVLACLTGSAMALRRCLGAGGATDEDSARA